jgi:hypothetical protein
MIAASQIYLGRGGGAKLPYDAEVEYLESTGTQYIDTGHVPTASTRMVVDAAITSDAILPNMFGTYFGYGNVGNPNYARNYFRLFVVNRGGNHIVGSSLRSMPSLVGAFTWDADRHIYELWNGSESSSDIELRQGVFSVDGVESVSEASEPPSGVADHGIVLFGYRGNSANNPPFIRAEPYWRVYGVKIYEDGVLAYDFIPVRVGTISYMYDRVSGQLSGNHGTGDFLYGNDK